MMMVSGENGMRELTLPAKTDELAKLTDFLEELLDEASCPPRVKGQVLVVAEEIFVNIASYAYAPGEGDAVVRASVTGDSPSLTVIFIDSGQPFDPLAKEDPDVTLSAEERNIGGLGIFMTKKFMDEVSYEYKDGQNRLTLKKSFG